MYDGETSLDFSDGFNVITRVLIRRSQKSQSEKDILMEVGGARNASGTVQTAFILASSQDQGMFDYFCDLEKIHILFQQKYGLVLFLP